MTLRGEHVLVAALIIVCGGLGFAVGSELQKFKYPVGPKIKMADQDVPRPLPGERTAFAMPPIDSLSEIERRPLFFRERRPARPPARSSAVKPRPPPAIVLQGIVTSPANKSVFLRSATSSGIGRFKEGQLIEGWKLESILPDSISLKSGNRTQEIKLQIKGNSPKSIGRTRVPRGKSHTRSTPRRGINRPGPDAGAGGSGTP